MPQWRQALIKSLHKTRSMPESRFFQLATCDSHGMPQCRTVVFRGISDDNELIVISDTRTHKYTELNETPHAQCCWYFTKTREQYRLTTSVAILTLSARESLVREQWSKLSDAGKKQFLWGEPGTPRHDASPLHAEGDFSRVPDYFCVLLLSIESVDYLNLRGNPQIREWHTKDANDNWQCQPVIP